MSMRDAKLLIAVFGVLTPYLARIPLISEKGLEWLTSYIGGGVKVFLLVQVFNAVCWVPAILCCMMYRHPISLFAPAILGLGRLAYLHHDFDLASDAQAATVFAWFPILALQYVAIGAAIGLGIDLTLRRRRSLLPPNNLLDRSRPE